MTTDKSEATSEAATPEATPDKAPPDKAPPDNSPQIAALTIVLLALLVAPDWIAYWGHSAFNAIPTLPDIPLQQPTQTIAQRLQQMIGNAIDRLTRSDDDVHTVVDALIDQESAGNAQAQNYSGSGAMGLGQVMPENIAGLGRGWDFEALGRDLSESEFLASPTLQRQIIHFKVGQYWRSAIVAAGGSKHTACQRVASAWYSGDPTLYTSATPQYWNGEPYPSIADYARSVCRKTGW